MALTVGTNCGFVSVAPTADPNLSYTYNLNSNAASSIFVSPAGAAKITEIGWWCSNDTEEADFDVGVYTDAGAGEPEALVGKETVAKGTTAGWKKATGLNISISASTNYWLAVQSDNTAAIDYTFASNPYYAQKASLTELPIDWASSSSKGNGIRYAIYAVWEAAATGTKFQVNIGDSWKAVSAMKVNIGDSWKAVASAKVNIGDSWKTIF